MKKNIILAIIFVTSSFSLAALTKYPSGLFSTSSGFPYQDTIIERQLLYNGTIWTNMYHRIDGHQFLFSEYFLTGTVSKNGKTFNNVRIKYDIYSDEIIVPVNNADIIQMNKEMVDSFTISYEDKLYNFINAQNDTLKGFSGYLNQLYKGRSVLYIKYKKSIIPEFTTRYDGYFNQNYKMYLVKDNTVYPISGARSLYEVLNADKDQVRNFIRQKRLKLSKKTPENYIPILMYYDNLGQ